MNAVRGRFAARTVRVKAPGKVNVSLDVGPLRSDGYHSVASVYLAVSLYEEGASRLFEIGSADVVTYGGMIREYARQQGLRRWLIPVPLLTPYLSGLWLALVTPATSEVGRHLVEGLRNPTVVRDTKALDAFPIRPMGMQQAIQKALACDDWYFSCRRTLTLGPSTRAFPSHLDR